jgi:5'-nucleotidase
MLKKMLQVLLTNDDGIEADGLQALRRALLGVPGIELAVIAPDGNRSAMARSITTSRPLWVQEVDFGITYSGTVAAALEGVVLGLPAIAVSQQSAAREMDFRLSDSFDFDAGARFVARVVQEIDDIPLPAGTLLNVNCPAGEAAGVEVTRLGKRIYRDELKLDAEDEDGGRRYWIYGADPGFHDEPGTDLAAVHAGHIAVTPVHFDLTDVSGLDALTKYDLARLLAPAAREVQ